LEKICVAGGDLGRLQGKVEEHEKRPVRVETIIEIVKPDGTTLRILPGGGTS
jgi:hypothetical protein